MRSERDPGRRATGAALVSGASLLSNATAADVVCDPFPHLVIRNALDPGLSARLLEEMPPLDTLVRGEAYGSNHRISYPCHAARTNPAVSATWKRFLDEHVTPRFLARVIELFGASLRTLHPRFESRCGQVEQLRSGVRGIDGFDTADVLLDAQICANTPVIGTASAVRGAHIDAANKLLVGLYYLRHPADDSTGGDLQLYSPRPGSHALTRSRFTASDRFELWRTIGYEHNVFVFFLNSIHSVHLVTARSPTPYPRLLVNLIGEVKEPLWQFQRRAFDRLHQRVVWNSTAAMSWNAEMRAASSRT